MSWDPMLKSQTQSLLSLLRYLWEEEGSTSKSCSRHTSCLMPQQPPKACIFPQILPPPLGGCSQFKRLRHKYKNKWHGQVPSSKDVPSPHCGKVTVPFTVVVGGSPVGSGGNWDNGCQRLEWVGSTGLSWVAEIREQYVWSRQQLPAILLHLIILPVFVI